MTNAPIHSIPPKKGAAVEWWMYQVSRRLRAYDPTLVSIAADDLPLQERREGVSFERIKIGAAYRRLFHKITRLDPWSYAHRVARRLDRIRPDIIHVHNAPALAARLQSLCRHRDAKLVLHMHNAMPLEEPVALDRLYVVSDYLRDWYAQRYPRQRIEVITNGVDTRAFETPLTDRGELRARLGLPADRRVLLFVGRISAEKGVLDLLAAFEALLARRNDVFLLLLGEMRTRGKPGDRRADYGRRVQQACERLGPAHCRWAGVVPPDDIARYYHLADLLVVPSEFEEPFGMIAIEAMAAGLPVLAARKGGLPEFVVPGKTGYLIEDTKNGQAFAGQIDTLLSDPQALARVARDGQAYAAAHHDWSLVARRLEELYDSLLK